jgi:N-acyl-D-aspartate/D-glutamate deacylase
MLSVSPWHGVTTVVMGNCGFGVAPVRPDHHELIIRTLEKVEGMSAEALFEGLGPDWGFETFPEYLDAVDRRGTAINTAVMIGHTPLRLYVLGEDATERSATPDEVARMRALVREAIEAGALGFATSKSNTHVGYAGKPVPSRLAETAEIIEIARALGDVGHGVVQATVGAGLLFEEFGAITQATGGRMSWTALLGGTGPGVPEAMLAESIKLRERGFEVYPQVSCRPLMFEYSMAEPFPFESMRVFAPVSSAPDVETKMRIYSDPDWRKAFAEKMSAGKGGVLGVAWARTEVSWFPDAPELEGRNVAELAAERGVEPTELVLDLALQSGLQARFRVAALNYDEDEVELLLTDPHTIIGLSDAGAHASQLCDACFSTHLLSRWVRERKALSLEEAVRKLTSEPADVFGLSDRGLLAVGRPADVVVFDPDTVGATPLRRVADQPAGQERLVSDAVGIDAVIVNGTLIRQDGRDVVDPAGPLPGRLLRGGRAR